MMNQLIEHFEIWTDAQGVKSKNRVKSVDNISLEGISRLRELILELAVRGKLVEQDPNDEPASVLLKRIAKEKDRLIKEGVIKKQDKYSTISEDEKTFKLPIGWEFVRFGEISIINPRNDIENDTLVSFVPMNLITTSYTGKHGSEERKWSEIKQGFTHFADGDIGIAKITPCFENSKAVVFSNLKNSIGAGTTELHIARPYNDTLNARFVLLNLKSPHYLKVGESKMTGTAGQKRLPKSFFAEYPFPLPPIAEQHRIVAKVEELMSLCDQLEEQKTNHLKTHEQLVKSLLESLSKAANATELETAWERMSTHFGTLFCTEDSIDQLKQTILQLAVMGKLVKQNPADEPASVLLKKIAKEKEALIKDGKIKKQEKLPEIAEDEKPFELPMGWAWVRLGDITTINPRNNFENDALVSFIPMNLITTSYSGQHGYDERKWSEIKQGFTHFADGDIGIAKITPCFENSKAVIFTN